MSSPFLHQLELSLQKEYSLKQLQLESSWKQRSRVKWLLEGDKNTKFFHKVSKANSRKNLIHYLISEEGNYISDQAALNAYCHSF